MYASVNSTQCLRSPLLYNDQKVKAGQAVFLDAHNFWQEKDDLSLREIQQRFDNLTSLNERSEKKILHSSVNFHPDDDLSDKEMTRIAREFMTAIDFGQQPWLLYRHIDAGHPHMHIVSTNIQPDGSRILNDLRAPHHLIEVCSAIEEQHHLHPALSPCKDISSSDSGGVQRLTYGEIPTRTGIEMVLNYVSNHYTYTSFESFNAVLGLYNVRGDRGAEDGAMYQNRGLYYRMIDDEGKKLGAPIKASDFNVPVTLDDVEEQCRLCQQRINEQDLSRVRVAADFTLFGESCSLGQFREKMAEDRIGIIIPAFTRRPARGSGPSDLPGMFYMDFEQMTVFRDTELGPEYTAEAILRRCGLDKKLPELALQHLLELKPGEQARLENADLDDPKTRDLFLRLSVQDDRIMARKQEELEQSLTHRLSL